MFKRGDKVVCVCADGSSMLELNKSYVVYSDLNNGVTYIYYDDDTFLSYYSSRFVSLRKIRTNKLKQLQNVQSR